MPYYVYMTQNSFGKLYIGVSQDQDQRLKYHNSRRGSIYTKRGNFKIVFREEYETLTEARKREIQVKKWRRDKKELLIERFSLRLPTKQ